MTIVEQANPLPLYTAKPRHCCTRPSLSRRVVSCQLQITIIIIELSSDCKRVKEHSHGLNKSITDALQRTDCSAVPQDGRSRIPSCRISCRSEAQTNSDHAFATNSMTLSILSCLLDLTSQVTIILHNRLSTAPTCTSNLQD